MKSSVYKSYDELPLFLNSDLVAKTLGIAPKEKFIQWVEEHTKGGAIT